MRWDQAVSLISLNIKGIYDGAVDLTKDNARNNKLRTLAEIANGFNGELFHIMYGVNQEIGILVEHLMAVHSRPKVTILLQPLTYAGPLAGQSHTANSSSNPQGPNSSSPYGLTVAIANLAQTAQSTNPSAPPPPKTPTLDSLDLIQKYFTVVPLSELNNNPFTWDKPEPLKIPKFPTKCLDNSSVVNFAEEAFYIPGEMLASRMNTLFFDLEYPAYPRYFVDPTALLIKKQPLAVKGDVYTLDSKPLLDRFKILVAANPKLKKVLFPVYYYYQYEGNYQMVGYIKYEVYGKADEFCKLEFKHYPLKYLQLHEVLTNHKHELLPRLEKIIESLPRYSLNFYVSILRLNNVQQLHQKRFKFMFGFSVGRPLIQNKPASRSLEDDYQKHNKRVREIISKKSQICEQVVCRIIAVEQVDQRQTNQDQ